MSELDARLSGLSPERRAVLQRLMQARTAPAQPAPSPPASAEEHLVLDASSPSEPGALKASYKRFYDGVSAQLADSPYGAFSFFLNYGYVADGSPERAAVALPERYINRNSVKLVLELIGDCPVDGQRVLDVGCGRGGTVHTLTTFFKPAQVSGLDLSTRAIEFCRHAHKDSRVSFREGDAENLPFAAAAFDVVTNVESSHSYPSIHRFYAEVARVLSPGGHFLYTDALSAQQVTTSLAYLDHLGLELMEDRDITRNVLRSCDEVAATRVQAFDERNDQNLMRNFLATPGSQVYEEMRSGRWTYRIFKLRKPHASLGRGQHRS
jgi:phthiocerol/phenolphthiocerol synthesis type-I polyketide synthase E